VATAAMKYALTIALSLIAGAAQAQSQATESQGFNPLPPIEYDYPFEGKLIVTGADQYIMDRACPKATRQGTKILGCAYHGKNQNGEDQCWFILADDDIIKNMGIDLRYRI
jgi:co-chaperonin GroES (HSP10)